MEPHQQRVVDELRDLSEKRDKLAIFVNASKDTGVFAKLEADEKARLYLQLSIMNDYVRVLEDRISAF